MAERYKKQIEILLTDIGGKWHKNNIISKNSTIKGNIEQVSTKKEDYMRKNL